MMAGRRQEVTARSHRPTGPAAAWMLIAACCVLLAEPTPGSPGPAEDAYVAGLEREMDVKGGGVTLKDGVVTGELAGIV